MCNAAPPLSKCVMHQVCGVYAYATRKVSNWVPDALYELATDARRALALSRGSSISSEAVLGSGSAAGVSWGRQSPGTAPGLQQRAGGRSGGGGSGEEAELFRCPTCGATRRSAEDLAAHTRSVHGVRPSDAALGGGGRGGSGGRPLSSVPRNGPDRAVGRVLRYCNSSGAAFIPPAGHQLSLRYVLRCEVRLSGGCFNGTNLSAQ